MSIEELKIEEVLPHRYPFLFVDRVVSVEPGVSIHARKLVSNSDPILQGHFPGHPIMPGVVQVEAMAQAAVILAHCSGLFDPKTQVCYLMAVDSAKFRAPIVPGDVVDILVSADRAGKISKFSGKIDVNEELRSSAKFTAIIEQKGKV